MYKNPMSMDIAGGGSSQHKIIKNPKQIRFVINEIEKKSKNKVTVPKGNIGPLYLIFFHSGNVTFQQVQIYPDVNLVSFVSVYKNSLGMVERPKYVPLSPKLLSYVKKVLG